MTQLTSTTNEQELSLIDAIVYQAVGDNETLAATIKSNIQAYTNADRKRVALEAALKLLTYLLDERTEHMYMQNPDTGEMTGNGWLCNTSLSAVSANRIEAERRKRIAELKSQQEESES